MIAREFHVCSDHKLRIGDVAYKCDTLDGDNVSCCAKHSTCFNYDLRKQLVYVEEIGALSDDEFVSTYSNVVCIPVSDDAIALARSEL